MIASLSDKGFKTAAAYRLNEPISLADWLRHYELCVQWDDIDDGTFADSARGASVVVEES